MTADTEPTPAPEEKPPRVKATDREPLAVIQERLRQESARGLSGGKVRRGRQV